MQYLQDRKQDYSLEVLRTKARYGHLNSISSLCFELYDDEPEESYFWAGVLSRRNKSGNEKFLEKFGRSLTSEQKATIQQKIALWAPEPIPDTVHQAMTDIKERALAGDPKAQYSYGIELMVPEEYLTGYIIQQDIPQAIAFWKQSAEQGYGLAQIELGHVYARGWGVDRNITEALKYYDLAAKAGFSEAKDAIQNLKLIFGLS